MQVVKEKLNDMGAMRKAKAEARAEEKAEKELAKARVEIAHELRKAREAEAAMELHVAKADQKIDTEIAKHPSQCIGEPIDDNTHDHHHHGTHDHHHHHGHSPEVTGAPVIGTMFPTNTTGAPTTNNCL